MLFEILVDGVLVVHVQSATFDFNKTVGVLRRLFVLVTLTEDNDVGRNVRACIRERAGRQFKRANKVCFTCEIVTHPGRVGTSRQ